MASAKYSRIDTGRNSSSSYWSSITIFVFVALCLVGIWMMTSLSVVPVQNGDETAQEKKQEIQEEEAAKGAGENNGSNAQKFEASTGDLPDEAKKESSQNTESSQQKPEEKTEDMSNDETKSDDGLKTQMQDGENKFNDGDSKTEDGQTKTDGVPESNEQVDSEEASQEKKSELDGSDSKSDSSENSNENDVTKVDDSSSESNGGKVNDQIEEKVGQDGGNESEKGATESKEDSLAKSQTSTEAYSSGPQSELLNETMAQNGSFSTQAAESKNEKETQLSSSQQEVYNWRLCNTTAGPDYIPCLDNLQAIKSLHSTRHYEHRERHCPEQPPTCLVPLPEGYRRSIDWPKSREKIWFCNVPHTSLVEFKGHQNWVKVSGEYLTFPGGGTQFKRGAVKYIDFIQESVNDIAWGKRSRVVLDVGCGVASFGGFLFDKDVLTMSLAPKDEHEAQVQFALERGIPAISAVMGTRRLPFPARVFDVIHCARCRVPWHIEGGKLLLELNRVLRPGGFFVWSATPVYQKQPEDVEIWKAMVGLMDAMCWELINKTRVIADTKGVATFRKPTSNECFEKRTQPEIPICSQSDDANAAWNVPLQACMHKVPTNASERGSQWPEHWPARLEKTPYWLLSSQVGVYGKAAPEDFTADYEHWKQVVTKSYLNGMGISWSSVRNVMDMRAVYGGFAAALRDLGVWVMNIVTTDSPDTLPIIYERGLFGIYHDWCESFSTYPRSYDLLHADHLFSNVKKRCNLVAVVVEVDRILRPEGKLIVQDNVETINEVESMLRSMQWEVRTSFSKNNEGLLCVQKSKWRPTEVETVPYAIEQA